MKKFLKNRKVYILLLIALISVVFFWQYRAFVSQSDEIKAKNALSTIRTIYNHESSDIKKTYSEEKILNPSLEYGSLLTALKDTAVISDIEGLKIAVTVKTSLTRGRLLPVEGAVYSMGNDGRSISILDYLRKFTYDSSYSENDFSAAYDSQLEALTKVIDTETGEVYYVYYTNSDFLNIELVVFYDAELVDAPIDLLCNIADSFFYIELTVFILLIVWMLLDRVYSVITAKRQSEKMESIQRRYKTVLVNKDNYIWEYFPDSDTMIWDEANSTTTPLFDVSGRHRKELMTSNVIHSDDQWTFYQFCDDLVNEDPVVTAEVRLKLEGDEYIWFRFTGTKVFGEDGFPTSVIGQTVNINASKLETEKLREEAASDSLTKLYSYHAFEENAEAIISTNENAEIMALLLIDVDDFTDINTTFGYAFADALLVDIAGRLKKIFPKDTILGRFGGDEFLAFVRNVPSMSYVIELAQAVLSSVQNVMNESSQKYGLSCSIGISLYPVDDMSFQRLFSKADMALYDAKQKGKGRYGIYNTGMQQIPESTKNKNNIKLKMPSSSTNEHKIVDSTILANAIDILFDSRDLNMSISVMISIIAIYYKLDHVMVLEYNDINNRIKARILHEWASEKSARLPDSVRYTEPDKDDLFLGYEADANGTFFCNDTTQLGTAQKHLNNDPFIRNAASLIQFGIKYKSKYVYLINLSCSEPKNWTREELDSLTLLAKLIGSYLVQLRSQEALDFVSQMDSLTGSYNFTAFLQRADKRLASPENHQYAFIYADIQQFKLLNDTYGYSSGDSILLGITEILQRVGGPNALISRITGDRFVVMYPYENGSDLQDKIRLIIEDSKQIPLSDDEFYRFTLTLGIYLVEPGDTAMISVDRANIAMKNISDYHNCSYMFYDESMHDNLLEQKVIEDSMEEALNAGEFKVYYQPKINLDTLELIGSEALVRWQRDGSIVPPDKFIPVFEENGFILQLDYYMLDKVCATMRRCIDDGLPVRPVSVNFSRVHLSSTVLPEKLESTLKKYDIDPSLIEVEITESALNAKNTYQLRILNDIRSLGCHLSMDDFGSGMSSLNILRELPFDILKLDKDFLHNNVMTKREQVIIKNVVRLAKELDMRVICEGVETEAQAKYLQSIGCNYAQGYLFSKPIPEQDFIEKYIKSIKS